MKESGQVGESIGQGPNKQVLGEVQVGEGLAKAERGGVERGVDEVVGEGEDGEVGEVAERGRKRA